MSLLTTVFCEIEQRGYNLYDNQLRQTCPTDSRHLVYPEKCAIFTQIDTYGGFFGTAEDGDLVVNSGSTVVLARDTYYRLLTVYGVINTNGFRLFVANTLTIGSTGHIHNNGNDAVAEVGGGSTNSLGTLGYGGAGGTGSNRNGTSGAALPANTRLGGIGINGDTGATGTPGNAGAATTISAILGGVGTPRVAEIAITGRDYSYTRFNGGTGGGAAGAGDGQLLSASGNVIKVNGGGGGGGGGVVLVVARFVVCEIGGKITANGGNGASISGGPSGGGGGGGVTMLITTTNPLSDIILTADPGTGGASPTASQFGMVYYLPV